MNAEEMQYITDNLFVGNKLFHRPASAPPTGCGIDLRNIRSPIIVFCSWGDDITPPPQALDSILDLYNHEDEIVADGQTIVYTLHQTVGHLGIFVSGQVATKEDAELVQCMDLIDLLPPGLYEAVITDADPSAAVPRLVRGRYHFALEKRTLNAIRALGCNDADDDRRFATVARLSEVNESLYPAWAVRAAVTPAIADAIREMHANRVGFGFFSDRNPFVARVAPLAEAVPPGSAPRRAGQPAVGARAPGHRAGWTT